MADNVSRLGWYPADPAYRSAFEAAMRASLKHLAGHGDCTRVRLLLEVIPDRGLRHEIAKSVAAQFPILIGANGKVAKDKSRAPGFDWSALDGARFWPKRIVVSDDRFYLKGEPFSALELIDEVIDALILQRHAIPDEGLRRLKNAVDAVARRRGVDCGSDPRDVEGMKD